MKYMITVLFLTICSLLKAPEYRTLYVAQSAGIEYFDMNDVNSLLKKYHIKSADTVRLQICLESAYLRSSICKSNKNLIGMRFAPLRKTTAIGERFGCAIYSSYESCIADLKIYQGLYFKRGDYYSFLERIGYATDPKYIETLKKIRI